MVGVSQSQTQVTTISYTGDSDLGQPKLRKSLVFIETD